MRTLSTIAVLSLGLIIVTYVGIIVYFYNVQRAGLFPGASFNEALPAPDDPIPNATAFTLKTEDGETIAAWYRPPKPGQPVILFCHGNAGGLELRTRQWSDIAARGAGILAFSYRGFPGSTGRPSEVGIAKDAMAAYRWLRGKHDARDIIIHGHSLGSGVATGLAETVDARALVLEAPFLSAADLAAYRFPYLPVSLMMRDPFLSRERIAKIGMPVLIAHGTADAVIPFEHGKQLFERAINPKTFKLFEGGEHSDLPERGLYDAIWAFAAGAS